MCSFCFDSDRFAFRDPRTLLIYFFSSVSAMTYFGVLSIVLQ